uniref:uncharacterized protein LOC120339938 isoform X1 n=1 Tax=Styela clava TaxID=7725 RepID=UPI00193A7C6C|nr:uncharacterized protein LOC120339938 isoform X1 [Styela clava]
MDDEHENLKERLNDLRITSSTNIKKTQETLNFLKQVFNPNDSNKKICDLMVDCKFFSTVSTIWKTSERDSFDIYCELETPRGKVFQSVKDVMWSYTDKNRKFCKALHDNKIVHILLEELKFIDKCPDFKDDFKRQYVKATLGILHNLVRNYNDISEAIRGEDGIETIKSYGESEYLIIKTYAFMILSYCVRREDVEQLFPGKEVFEFVLKLLKESISAQNHVCPKYGISAYELVDALSKATKDEKNAMEMINADYLPTILKMLDLTRFSEKEVLAAVEIIWGLTLHTKSKADLLKSEEVPSEITKLSQTKNLQKLCSSVLYTLSSHEEHKQRHVMLSYQWDIQESVEKLYEYLVKEGFKVWMDIHRMKGSTLESMAEAVENASIIVMCVTEKYKESHNCKREAEYAAVRKVPILPLKFDAGYDPKGWLGIIMGAALYVEVDKNEPSKKFQNIKTQIEQLQKN